MSSEGFLRERPAPQRRLKGFVPSRNWPCCSWGAWRCADAPAQRIIAMDAKNANSLAIILPSQPFRSLFGSSMQRNLVTQFLYAVFLVAVQLAGPVTAQSKLTIDCSKPVGTFRALHGVNGGV